MSDCKHKWVFQCTDFNRIKMGHTACKYQRIDTYYCEKCLEIKEKINKEKEWCDEAPYWVRWH